MDYHRQLVKKQEECQKLFPHLNVHSVEGMEHPYEYRNKVIVAFNQKYEYGLYEESSHKIVPTQKCLLHDEETHKILSKIQSLFRKYRMSKMCIRDRFFLLNYANWVRTITSCNKLNYVAKF